MFELHFKQASEVVNVCLHHVTLTQQIEEFFDHTTRAIFSSFFLCMPPPPLKNGTGGILHSGLSVCE